MSDFSSKALIQAYVKLLLEQFHEDPEINTFFGELDSFRAIIERLPEKEMSSPAQNYFLEIGNNLWGMVQMNPNKVVLHQAQIRFEELKQSVNWALNYTLFPDKPTDKTPTKITKPKPEAPKNAPFGQYLFAPNRNDIKYKVNEPNTPKEQELLNQLKYHYNADSNKLGTWAPKVINMINKGQYKKILAPPKKTVYRLLWNVDPKIAAKLLNLNLRDITEQSNKPWYVEGGGTIRGKGNKNIQSWTTTMSTEWIVDLMERGLKPNTIAIVLGAHTEGNNFFINPKGAEEVEYLPKTIVKKEQEVISYGPVNFFEASFYYKVLKKEELEQQVKKTVILLKKIHKALLQNVDLIIAHYLNLIKDIEMKKNQSFYDYGDRIRTVQRYLEIFQTLKTTEKIPSDSRHIIDLYNIPPDVQEKMSKLPLNDTPLSFFDLFSLYSFSWAYGGPDSKKIDNFLKSKLSAYNVAHSPEKEKKEITNIVSQLSKAMKFKLKK